MKAMSSIQDATRTDLIIHSGISFGLSVLVWQHLLGIPLSWLNLPITFIVLVAVGSDYNLLLIPAISKKAKPAWTPA